MSDLIEIRDAALVKVKAGLGKDIIEGTTAGKSFRADTSMSYHDVLYWSNQEIARQNGDVIDRTTIAFR